MEKRLLGFFSCTCNVSSIASTRPIVLSCVLCHVLLTCKPVKIDYVFIISKDANVEGTDFDGFSRVLLILRIYLI